MSVTPEQLAKAGSESAHQKALFCWAALPENRIKYPELEFMYAVPNGGKRNAKEAANLRAQGVKSGVPDICLPLSRKNCHGLYIEMKIDGNTLSETQERYEKFLRSNYYGYAICWSWQDAVDVLEWYLKL